jgi:SNF2 family DNA or RNA helicase
VPSLFDSHEEFSEWFSKDIENAAGGGDSGSLKPEQLRRLHMILKPFMLRRVKKHVQKPPAAFSMSLENHSENSSCESNREGMMKCNKAHNSVR